jgi:5'(3')-deoxyribonucleotidase
MKPRIGIDIDDVLSETTRYAISELKKRHNHHMNFEEVLYFEWPKIEHFPLDLPTTIEFFREILRDTDAIDRIQPIEHSVSSIRSLCEDFELHAITARHISTSEATHLWTEKHFGDAFNDRVEFL